MCSRRYIRPGILLAIVALALAACDPVGLPFTVVHQVTGVDDSVYAYAVRRRGWGPGCCTYGEPAFYSSQDGGLTWAEIETPPPELAQRLQEARTRTSTGCDPGKYPECVRVDGLGHVWMLGESASDGAANYPFSDQHRELAYKSLDYRPVCSQANPLTCFRLGRQGQIERSLDGGANWGVDWQLSDRQRELLARRAAHSRRGYPTDTRPLDLAVLDTAEGVSAIAALGNQGVMVRTPEGVWEQRAVENARPLPNRAESLEEAFRMVYPEAALSAAIACLFAFLVSAALAVALRSFEQETPKAGLHPWLFAYVGLALVILVLIQAPKIVPLGIVEDIPVPCSSIFLGLVLVNWLMVPKAAKKRRWLRTARRAALTSPAILFAVTFVPYVLWLLGAIANRQVAAWWSGGLGSVAAALCLVWIIRSAPGARIRAAGASAQ